MSLTSQCGGRAWLPSSTLALPHCIPHNLGFPGGLIGWLISSLKPWKQQSGTMWVLEIKSINDLTTTPLSSSPPPVQCAPLLPLTLLLAFVNSLKAQLYSKHLSVVSVFRWEITIRFMASWGTLSPIVSDMSHLMPLSDPGSNISTLQTLARDVSGRKWST